MKHTLRKIVCFTILAVVRSQSNSIATYSIGPLEAYNIASTATVTPRASGIIVAEAASTDNVVVYLSPEIAEAAGKAIDGSCKSSFDSQCVSNVLKTFETADKELQTRQIGALAAIGAVVLGMVAGLIQHSRQHNGGTTSLRKVEVPAAQVEAAKQAGGASTILIVPSASPTVTFVQSSAGAPTPTGNPTPIPKLEIDKGTGDLLVKIDSALLKKAVELLHHASDGCISLDVPANPRKRAASAATDGALCAAELGVRNAQALAPLASFSLVPTIHLQWSDAAVAAAAARLLNFVQTNAGLPQSVRDGMLRAAPLLFSIAIEEIFFHRDVVQDAGSSGVVRVSKDRFSSTPTVDETDRQKSQKCTSTTATGSMALVGCTRIGPMEQCSSKTVSTSLTACVKEASRTVSDVIPTLTTEYLPWTVLEGDMTFSEPSMAPDPVVTGVNKDSYCKVKKAQFIEYSILEPLHEFYVYGRGFGNKNNQLANFRPLINKECGTLWDWHPGNGEEANGKVFDWLVKGSFRTTKNEVACLTRALKAYGASNSAGCDRYE